MPSTGCKIKIRVVVDKNKLLDLGLLRNIRCRAVWAVTQCLSWTAKVQIEWDVDSSSYSASGSTLQSKASAILLTVSVIS